LCHSFAELRIFQAMLRILNFFSRYSYLLVVLALAILLQASLAQNSTAAQETTHKPDTTKEPSGIVGVPAGNDSEQKSTQQSNPSRLVLGPGDEVEITV
jgi:hypothetical protein